MWFFKDISIHSLVNLHQSVISIDNLIFVLFFLIPEAGLIHYPVIKLLHPLGLCSLTNFFPMNPFSTPWKHQKTLGSIIPQSNSSPSRKEPLKCWSSDIVIKFFWNNSYISKFSIAKNFFMFFISHPNYKSQGQSLVYLLHNRIIWF